MNNPRIDANDCLRIRDGRLFVEEVDANKLVERFGSPIFVLSEAQLRRNYRRYHAAFHEGWPDGPVDILPAFKANLSLAARRILSQEGAGADIYSAGELAGALKTGVDPARVSVNGGGKPRDHLRNCIAAGVRITVEDIDEIDRIQELATELNTTAKIRFRLKPAVPNLWKPTDFTPLLAPIDIAVQVYKSGIPPEYLVEMGHKVLAMDNVELVGLHFHAGRHHASLWYWEGLMVRLARLIGELCRAWGDWRPQEIDVGGGMAGPRDPSNKLHRRSDFFAMALAYPFLVGLRGLGESAYHSTLAKLMPALGGGHSWRPFAPTIEDYASTITTTLRCELHRQRIDTRGVRLQAEPGRGMYGDAGIHLARVKMVKRQTRPVPYTWVLVDTTCFFLADGVMQEFRHDVIVANKAQAEATLTADLVGHSCAGDRMVPDARLPEVEAGDVIAFLDTGAYQESSASNFNALPRPATVLVHGAEAEITKTAESLHDVFARDIVPERLGGSETSGGQAGADTTATG